MHKPFLFLLGIALFCGCHHSGNETVNEGWRNELQPEPDKPLKKKHEAAVELQKPGCFITNPDTSLCGITLENAKSAIAVIGSKDTVNGHELFHYYSKYDEEVLSLTQHPGAGRDQISIFRVEYADKADHGYRQLAIDTFITEKGIKLGMSKQQIIERLGTCYVALDSTAGYIELHYAIEIPNDSKTHLLAKNNMPSYYADYKLWHNKLGMFEFGFEYP